MPTPTSPKEQDGVQWKKKTNIGRSTQKYRLNGIKSHLLRWEKIRIAPKNHREDDGN
jgi:hypothetical protein